MLDFIALDFLTKPDTQTWHAYIHGGEILFGHGDFIAHTIRPEHSLDYGDIDTPDAALHAAYYATHPTREGNTLPPGTTVYAHIDDTMTDGYWSMLATASPNTETRPAMHVAGRWRTDGLIDWQTSVGILIGDDYPAHLVVFETDTYTSPTIDPHRLARLWDRRHPEPTRHPTSPTLGTSHTVLPDVWLANQAKLASLGDQDIPAGPGQEYVILHGHGDLIDGYRHLLWVAAETLHERPLTELTDDELRERYNTCDEEHENDYDGYCDDCIDCIIEAHNRSILLHPKG